MPGETFLPKYPSPAASPASCLDVQQGYEVPARPAAFFILDLLQADLPVCPDQPDPPGAGEHPGPLNYFNYSDPGKVNIEITVLGGVKNPGRYLIPEGTNVIELLSLSGNVLQEETADNIRLIRTTQQSGKLSDSNIVTLNYREIFKDEKIKSINKPNPLLVHGDILVVPIKRARTFWDDFLDVSFVITPLVSLATLVVSIISLSK